MAVENIEATSVAWKQIADMWNTYFTPPSRISPGEVKKYRQWLKKIKKGNMKALVLGVTPEIREALAEFGYETTCIDINKEMIQAMNSLIKIKNPDEMIVNENWLANSLEGKSFDVVLGDAVFPNIPWKEWKTLLSEVRRVLKPNGVFITRAFCVPRKKPFASLDEIFRHFSKKEPTYKSALAFTLEIMIYFYNPSDHLGTFKKSKEVLEKVRGENGFNFDSQNLNKILDIVWNFWCTKFIEKVFVYAYRDEEEALYGEIFEIVETFESADNSYSKITPMYLFKLKS